MGKERPVFGRQRRTNDVAWNVPRPAPGAWTDLDRLAQLWIVHFKDGVVAIQRGHIIARPEGLGSAAAKIRVEVDPQRIDRIEGGCHCQGNLGLSFEFSVLQTNQHGSGDAAVQAPAILLGYRHGGLEEASLFGVVQCELCCHLGDAVRIGLYAQVLQGPLNALWDC